MPRVAHDRSSERGAALVIVVVWLPVLVLFAMFVLEVGNWYEHKRHLQMQADGERAPGHPIFGH